MRLNLYAVLFISFTLFFAPATDAAMRTADTSAEAQKRWQLRQNPESFQLPADIGNVDEFYFGETGKLIILIRDIHSEPSAQLNLASILKILIKDHGLDTVFIEGGTGDDSLSFLRGLATPDIRKRVAKKFLMQGEISGEEYLSLAEELDFSIWGIEDPVLYENSLLAYARVVEMRDEALGYLDRLHYLINVLKTRLYPGELLNYESKVKPFLPGFTPRPEHVWTLRTHLESKGLKTGILGDLDFGQPDFEATLTEVRRQRNEILNSGLGGYKDAGIWLKRIEGASVSGLRVRPLADRLSVILKEQNAFGSYRQFLSVWKRLDDQRQSVLFDELHSLEKNYYLSFKNGDVFEFLRRVDAVVQILKRHFMLRVTPEMSEYLGSLDLEAALNLKRLGSLAGAIKLDSVHPGEWPGMGEMMRRVSDFYGTVDARDHAFVRRAEIRMGQTQIETASMIIGGYHTSRLASFLKQKEISYLIITPESEFLSSNRYEELLLSEDFLAS